MLRRRQFLRTATTAAFAATIPNVWAQPSDVPSVAQAAPERGPIRVGSCTIGLENAAPAGLDGIEVNVGPAADQLTIASEEALKRYQALMQQTGVPICSLMMSLLNSHPLARDPRGPAWLEQSIAAAKTLKAPIVLVAFFGEGDLLDSQGQIKANELEVVVQRLKDAAPIAKEAGVTLAVENYLSGQENARLLDRIDHEAVRVYYDVYNTGTTKGHDVPADIRLLGSRIVQFHFKNGPHFLDHEPAKFEPIAAAIQAIHYRDWVVLETSSPTQNPVEDTKRNADYLRSLFR